MRRLLPTALLLVGPLLACATVTPRAHQGPQGTIVGVITLPEGVSPGNACEHLQVRALNAQGLELGDPSIHAGHNRCSYTVNYVQANVPVTLAVSGTADVCGARALTPKDLPGTLQLQESETRLIDLAVSCAQ
jgi:hypothetical protein